MSGIDSPAGSPGHEKSPDGLEKEFEDEVAAADSDRESEILSEVDEDQFEDYDPETANIEDRPVDIDEDVARTLKATKRKRVDGETVKRPREGRRDKRRDRTEETRLEDTAGDEGGSKSRRARRGADVERAAKSQDASPGPQDEENLTPEERRKRAIDRALDAAIKKTSGTRRKKKDEIVSLHNHQQPCPVVER
jgi:transcription factor SPN1